MLEGVDIRLEGELLFLALGELTLTIVTGLARLPPWTGVLDMALWGAGEVTLEAGPD